MITGSVAAIIAIAILFTLVALHVPIGVAMGLIGVIGFGLMTTFSAGLSILATEAGGIMTNFNISIIPLFLLMGAFTASSGMADDLFRIAYALIGHRRGGLASANILGCGVFGAIAGSAPATTATFTRISIPQMEKHGYDRGFAAGSVAAGGTLGVMIPPSVIMAIYALMTEQFVIDLFIASVIPGLLAIVFYFIAISWVSSRNPDLAPAGEKLSRTERIAAFKNGWAVILLFSLVTIGIYSGIFTIVEAAALGALLSFIFALIQRRMTMAQFWQALMQTAATSAMIYISIIGASVFATFLGLTQAATEMIHWIEALGLPSMGIILAFVLLYLVLGALFDEVAAMLLTLPVVFPVVTGLGYDPIWWGVINVVVINLGMITPPVGLNVFIINGIRTDIGLSNIYRGVMPFIIADFVRLGLLIAVPGLSLWLLQAIR
ncbi:TRAP transporter large permease [Leucothrix sargassi]|nr:TRAP transporter large permease [Leucothrix sargassi]